MGQLFLYGVELQMEKLSKMGDPFIKMNKIINWEIFRQPLESALRKEDYSKGGRPPWDVILMFKITMLMSWYNLSYNQTEYQINNRLDFMRFLGVEVGAKLPDKNTIWDFKEAIKDNDLDRELFDLFNKTLVEDGFKLNSGTIVDASFVEVPRRRIISETELKNPEKLLNNPNVKVAIEKTETETIIHPNDGKADFILPQVDFDARYTKKNGETFFGYKDHTAVDKDTKFIIGYDVTSAEVHDSQVFLSLIASTTNAVWADLERAKRDIGLKNLGYNMKRLVTIKFHIA